MYLKLIFFQDWYYWYVYHDDKKGTSSYTSKLSTCSTYWFKQDMSPERIINLLIKNR